MAKVPLPLREFRLRAFEVFGDRTITIVRFGQKAALTERMHQLIQKLAEEFEINVALALEVSVDKSYLALSSVGEKFSSCFSVFHSIQAVNLSVAGTAAANKIPQSHRYVLFI